MSITPVRVGLLGCGNVGAALVTLVGEQRAEIAARTGIELAITRIAVHSVSRDRGIEVDRTVLTTDAGSITADPDIDVVVEVMGGIEPARTLILEALGHGKSVVTANKELLANHGAELYAAAAANEVDLLFEAAVAGAIPIMRPLRKSLVGEPIRRVMGIVNGTTNYILSQMSDHGATYAEALAEAQRLGYAERDPTADVEGYDAGAKAAIIATVAFGTDVVAGDVSHEGISRLTASDIDVARRLGHVVKLLAICELVGTDDDARPVVAVRVHPAMLPDSHPLAAVRDSFNAVFIEGGAAGELMLYGRGAGGRPTASSVLGDLIDAATGHVTGASSPIGALTTPIIQPIDDLESAYYLDLEVTDEPGVLAAVATVFGEHGVSIRSMEQTELGPEARIVFITHVARERDVQGTLTALRGLDAVRRVGTVLRVIASEESS